MASPKPISITYSVDGTTKTEAFDFLVVACDPRFLADALRDRTPFEDRVNADLQSFTFRTSLFKAVRPERARRAEKPNYAVRFNPGVVEAMDGRPYGFRDEVFAHDEQLKPSPTGETWCTLYQLDGRPLVGENVSERKAALDELRDSAIASNDKDDAWIDWEPKVPQAGPEESILVDYFAHFSTQGLDQGLPWDVIDHQGDKNTFYVASFTCFESVLHCYLYEEELMNPEGKVMQKGVFPSDKNARVAVVGAGPSGLLFASQHLKRKGYNNFVVFEKESHIGGKTFTFQKPIPANPSKNVPCELGTCYLSPAYEPMWWMFEEYGAGEVVALDQGSARFRSIIDGEVASNDEERQDGVDYSEWVLRKNGPLSSLEKVKMTFATVKYIALHFAVMGTGINDPLPEKSPDEQSILGNIRRLVSTAKDMEDSEQPRSIPSSASPRSSRGSNEVGVRSLYQAVKNEKRDHDKSTMQPRGLFNVLDDIGDSIEDALSNVVDLPDATDFFSIADLELACKEVFSTPFDKYLDIHGMGQLKTIFTYGYSVQGYGPLSKVPAYYGMVWLTPPTFLFSIKHNFGLTTGEERNRGTVNIATLGWGTLWDKVAKRDLADKIVLNAKISSITRSM